MAKKPTSKQLAARKKFIAAVKSGKFRKKKTTKKKAAKKAVKKKATKKKTNLGKAVNRINANALKVKLLKDHLRLPHGYDIVKRKR